MTLWKRMQMRHYADHKFTTRTIKKQLALITSPLLLGKSSEEKHLNYYFQNQIARKPIPAPIEVDYVNGSFLFFRAVDFDQIGGFDTNIFLYFEESDICYRLKKENRKTYFLPNASYLHYQGVSINKAKIPIAIKIELKTSMFYVIRKNYGYTHYQLLRFVFILRYGITSLVKPKYFKLFYRILIGLPLGTVIKTESRLFKNELKEAEPYWLQRKIQVLSSERLICFGVYLLMRLFRVSAIRYWLLALC